MPNEILLKEREGPVLVLAFNRPETRNALTPELAEVLALALDEARYDDSVRAVVLTGAGGSFCSGIDLSGLMGMLSGDPTSHNRRGLTRKVLAGQLHAAIRSLWDLPKPTVAAVEGAAAGFGLDLACACDLRVVAKDAKLSYTFTRRGLVPDGGTGHYLPRMVGLGRALELVLLGEPFDGERAYAMGLANRVVPAGAARPAAEALAADIARFPQTTMRGDRKSAYASTGMALDAALANEFAIGMGSLASGEAMHGATAFTAGKGRHGTFG